MQSNKGGEDIKDKYATWCKEFMFKPKQELSEETFFVFMTCSINERNGSIVEVYEKFKSEFIVQLMEKREKVMDLELTKAVRLWFASICTNPGIAVMYLAILKYEQMKRGLDKIDMEKLSYIFPAGFLKEEDLYEMWDKQKIGGINMLDDFNIYRS